MKKLLILIGIVVTVVLHAQQFAPQVKWQFTVDSMTYSTGVVESDDGYIVSLLVKNYSYNHFLIKSDSAGNIIWNTHLDSISPPYVEMNHIKKISGGYVLLGNKMFSDSTGVVNTMLIQLTKINQNGSIAWSYDYGDTLAYHRGMDIEVLSDGSYVVSGSVLHPIDSVIVHDKPLLVKFDSLGNMVWEKSYYFPGTFNEAYSVSALNNGFGILVFSEADQYPWPAPSFFLRTNLVGDSISGYPFSQSQYITSFDRSNYDSSLMFASYNWDTIPVANQFGAIKLNQNGSYITENNFNYANQKDLYIQEIFARKDSGYVALFDGDNDTAGLSSGFCPWVRYRYTTVSRISESGDTMWTKKLGGYFGNSFTAVSIYPTNDGGYLVTGQQSDSAYSQEFRALIVKLGPDSIAQITTKVAEQKEMDVSVYPNPTNDQIVVQLQNSTDKREVSFELYDIAGKLIQKNIVENQKSIFSLKQFKNGCYFYKIIQSNKIIKTGKIVLIE